MSQKEQDRIVLGEKGKRKNCRARVIIYETNNRFVFSFETPTRAGVPGVFEIGRATQPPGTTLVTNFGL